MTDTDFIIMSTSEFFKTLDIESYAWEVTADDHILFRTRNIPDKKMEMIKKYYTLDKVKTCGVLIEYELIPRGIQ